MMEPGRSSAARVFFSNLDLRPCLKHGANALAVACWAATLLLTLCSSHNRGGMKMETIEET